MKKIRLLAILISSLICRCSNITPETFLLLDQPVAIREGATLACPYVQGPYASKKTTAKTTLYLTMNSVEDLRCIDGKRCAPPGNAKVSFTFRAGGKQTSFLLNTDEGEKEHSFAGFTVRLEYLTPKTISVNNQQEYIATVFIVTP